MSIRATQTDESKKISDTLIRAIALQRIQRLEDEYWEIHDSGRCSFLVTCVHCKAETKHIVTVTFGDAIGRKGHDVYCSSNCATHQWMKRFDSILITRP
jgi:hypothetical protein